MASEAPPKAPVPPFSYEDAVKKVRMAENAWNMRDPSKVKVAYTADTKWYALHYALLTIACIPVSDAVTLQLFKPTHRNNDSLSLGTPDQFLAEHSQSRTTLSNVVPNVGASYLRGTIYYSA